MADPHTPTTLVDWLDDLTVRFLLNLPSSELSSVPRLCFQVEEAQWYYEDFVRPAVAASGAPPLPSLPLRQFCLLLFQHCPLFDGFSGEQHLKAYEEFLAYKVRVPVRGAILLDERMEKVVLVRGWKKGASWSFPRGKINKDEKDLHCAIREVWEETGFDIRAAGLVPEVENDAKAIDVTMREQHMRLFVFRGVPEDTHFEPKTRKEISKIQWYSIKDLPGFKNQKTGQPQQGGDSSSANKFYMVAPFLGHLKKWINQQRREDAARAKRQSANGNGLTTGTEDEGDMEEDVTPERDSGVDLRSEELKKLLSIGGGTPTLDSDSQAQPSRTPSDSANLLSLLQGGAKLTNGSQIPRTPFDQINLFPPQPESPPPHHMRQTSSSEQQRGLPPSIPISPAQPPQDAGRYHSLPTPSHLGPTQNNFPPPNQIPSGYHRMPPHMQQQQLPPQKHSMPIIPPPGLQGVGQGNRFDAAPLFHPQHQGPPSQQLPPQMSPPHLQQQAFVQHGPPQMTNTQGSQGPIGSGPSVPNASQLPAPRQLGAEKMRLLDAFRNASNRATLPVPAASGQAKQWPASTHQNALLDLFRKPSQPSDLQAGQESVSSPTTESREVLEPVSPTGTDITVKPRTVRRPTKNEITRTLPVGPSKAKSPPVASDMQSFQQNAFLQPEPVETTSTGARVRPDPPKERQLFDPNNPMKYTPANFIQQSKPETLEHSDRKRQSREFKNATSSTSPSRNGGTSQNGNRKTPPFTILARPGSAKGGPKSPVAPPSPLRNESTKAAFHPQVLKRPKEIGAAETDHKPADKKGQLLALFGKTASKNTATPPPASTSPHSSSSERNPSAENQKSRLLDLFNASTPAADPPPKPRIEPSQRPTSSRQQPSLSTASASARALGQSQQQNLLLDLFTGKRQGTPTTTSPGTPISPFTLGTPAVEELKKRMGSLSALANVVPTVGASGDGGEQSPQERKEFLMGFLEGVVRSERAGGGGGR